MKLTQKDIEVYIQLKSEIKAMEAILEPIEEAIKLRGSGDMGAYAITVSDRSRDYLPGIKEMIVAIGADRVMPLIKTSTFKVVNVVKK